MTFSESFIRRPVGTTLLAIGLMLIGIAAYRQLPVASLPTVDLPTISVSSSRPGADPATMAATVAAPLERYLGEISGITEITSRSSLGNSSITVQFDLDRNIVGAARDVQAALNAAATDLPSDLPSLPVARKFNPNSFPILILALTSDTITPAAIYDTADTVLAQRIAQIEGVAQVDVNGAEQPATRVRVDPSRIAAMGISMEQLRSTIVNANALTPLGMIDGETMAQSIEADGQMLKPSEFGKLVVKTVNGSSILLGSVATIAPGVRNVRSSATYNGKPSVLLVITKQANANVIETVDRIYALLPELKRFIPAGIDISVLTDRTSMIRSSIGDLQNTLLVTIGLVMLVVYVFLRRLTPTLAAGVTVPLALAGTAALMWCVGYSIDTVSLLALLVSVGFVVDDAIVIIENVERQAAFGMNPMRAAIEGARQIGFTVLSISVSLIAAFIPLLLMGGIIGRFLREFSVTLVFAIVISTIVSLTVTPMICAHLVRHGAAPKRSWLDRLVEGGLSRLVRAYSASLERVLNHRFLTMMVMVATIALTVVLFARTPKGLFPQDETGLIFAFTEAATDISFPAMRDLQAQAAEIALNDPAVSGVGSSCGSSGFGGSVNQGRMFINLKPPEKRDGLSAVKIVERMREKMARLVGLRVYLNATADLRVGGRSGKSPYQFTLLDADFPELVANVPKVLEAVKAVPGLVDVGADREPNGLEAKVIIDRAAAARLGVRIQDIDDALNNSFSQRQISTVYTTRNQYRIVLEADQRSSRDPSDIGKIYVTGSGGVQVPLSEVARVERGLSALLVNHQGQLPAVTISFGLEGDGNLDAATAAIQSAVAALHLPDGLRAEFAGDAKAFAAAGAQQGLLILGALVAVYIVLGILYESLLHPLTIISTLPSAGLGALLALQVTGSDLSVIALIGIILLIGIVKKNGIMLVDFALEAQRQRGLSPADAIKDACRERFRPILMTTMASLLGAVPLLVATGPGTELRRPLGVTIAGGLLVSQVLTLYTTPVVYLLLERMREKRARRKAASGTTGAAPPGPRTSRFAFFRR